MAEEILVGLPHKRGQNKHKISTKKSDSLSSILAIIDISKNTEEKIYPTVNNKEQVNMRKYADN
jgi:hypothetical protein